VRFVGQFHPAYRLSPRLTRGGERIYTVLAERDGDLGAVASSLESAGARVLSRGAQSLVVSAPSARLEALAARDGVAWIEDFVLRKKNNDSGGGVIMGAAVANGLGYTGSSQTVAVADTGIGDGTPAGAHPSIPSSRIAAVYNWPGAAGGCFQSIVNDGARDVDSGHGTHTTVSALGGGETNGRGRGTAPEARLVFQAVENWANISSLCQILYGYPNGYYLTGLPTDLRTLYQQAYSAGARIHSNSWGADVYGQYTTDSVNTDDFVWGHRDMAITFSAGNAGTDADGNGGVDGDSMGAPATAKNVISVGASENARTDGYPCDAGKEAVCAYQGGANQVFTYGSAWPFDFPANPLKDDPSAGNSEQMAAFSSRGPTDDGRIKPDVVAPGTWLLSGYSALYRAGYDSAPNPQDGLFQYDGWGYPASGEYKYMGGTSMANPLVAGGAAVVRDYYQQVHGHAASAALVKATLVNSAVDLLDENNDGIGDNAFAIPNFYEGWGRVDLAAATDGSREFREESAGLQTGGTRAYSFSVSASTPFKVSLAWSDYRGTSSATKMLVNDLDLEVAGPGGALYKGNVFGRGWAVTGGARDNTNNVENVFVQSPVAGTWTVTVKAYNVPQGPQPFAVVVAGLLGGGPTDAPPSVTLTFPGEGAVVSGTIALTADASDDVSVSRVDFYVDASLVGSDTSAPFSASWNTTATPNGAHVVRAVAVDSAGQTAEDPSAVTVQNNVAARSHVSDLDGRSSRYNSNRWRADVTIAVRDDLGQPVANATVRGSWSRGSGGTTSCVTGSAGTCGVWRTIPNNQTSVVWTVTSVSHASLAYDPAANGDPDGDSNGTAITVLK
jgi:subtilisin family serine protease